MVWTTILGFMGEGGERMTINSFEDERGRDSGCKFRVWKREREG